MLNVRNAVRSRAGFTLVEMLVALGILAALIGVMATGVVGRAGAGEVAAIAQNMNALNRAMQSFRQDVGRYPSRLSQLTAPLAASDRDLCGRGYPDPARWVGPYLDRTVTAAGLAAGTATVVDGVRRSPATATGNSFGELLLDVDGVDRVVADEVERAFDGSADLTGGSVRWVATEGTARGRLTFALPIRGC